MSESGVGGLPIDFLFHRMEPDNNSVDYHIFLVDFDIEHAFQQRKVLINPPSVGAVLYCKTH